ncbi:MAG: hypothetical protein ACKVPX_09885 [Myxococcaceae bacterium]
MGIFASPLKRRRLGELLMDAGLISETQLRHALSEQRRWGGRLGRTLLELGYVNETAMAEALSKQLRLPAVDLDAAELPADAPRWLRLDVAERYGVFPLQRDTVQKVLRIATADPTNAETVQALTFYTGMRIELAVASTGAIERALKRGYSRGPSPAPTGSGLLPPDRMAAFEARIGALEGQLALAQRQISAQQQLIDELLEAQTAPQPARERATPETVS